MIRPKAAPRERRNAGRGRRRKVARSSRMLKLARRGWAGYVDIEASSQPCECAVSIEHPFYPVKRRQVGPGWRGRGKGGGRGARGARGGGDGGGRLGLPAPGGGGN